MNELIIDGVIGDDLWGGISAASVRSELSDLSGDIEVRLNSIGGVVHEGIAIYNALRSYAGDVTIVIDGLAASIASVIAQAGEEIVMLQGAQMMVHEPHVMTFGDAAEHAKSIEMLRSARESILDIYVQRGADREQMAAWVAEETWFTASGAVDAQLADRAEESVLAKAWTAPTGLYRHCPESHVDPEAPRPDQMAWRTIAQRQRLEIESRR